MFIWKDEYSVKIEEVDDQHKRFFEILNELYAIIKDNEHTRDTLTQKLSELGNYGLYHLSAEEELFEKYDYSDKLNHIKVHNDYREKTKKYLKEVAENENDPGKLIEEIAKYYEDWMLSHILNMDKTYSKELVDKGAK